MAPKFQKGPDLKRFMVRVMMMSGRHEGGLCLYSLVERERLLYRDMCLVVMLLFVVVLYVSSNLSTFTLHIIFLTNYVSTQDKRLKVSLNGNRKVVGTLRGYDAFLNVVLEEVESVETGQYLGQIVIRGNSIVQFEGIDRVAAAAAAAATT